MSNVQAKIYFDISNISVVLTFASKFIAKTSAFWLKTGINDVSILLLNVKFNNLRSGFQTWAVLMNVYSFHWKLFLNFMSDKPGAEKSPTFFSKNL